MADPTFSVIVPAYNAAATIGETLASALEQSLAPAQVIVCDDGSTDDLAAAVAPFRDRIVLLRQEHAGAAAAKNAALAAAEGDFVAVLDADDTFEPTRLERLAALAAARPELDILASDSWFEIDGRITGRFYAGVPFPAADQRCAILRYCWLTNPAVRRSRLLAAGGFDPALALAEDWDCWLRLVLGGAVAGLVDEPLARYRIHSASLTAQRALSLRHRVLLLEKTLRTAALSPRERRCARRSLRRHRIRWLDEEAHDARRSGDRRRLLALAATRHATPGFRLRAATGALAPRRPLRDGASGGA